MQDVYSFKLNVRFCAEFPPWCQIPMSRTLHPGNNMRKLVTVTVKPILTESIHWVVNPKVAKTFQAYSATPLNKFGFVEFRECFENVFGTRLEDVWVAFWYIFVTLVRGFGDVVGKVSGQQETYVRPTCPYRNL